MPNIEGIIIENLGHDSFKLVCGGVSVYIDPFKIEEGQADVILVTHEHFDHCDPQAIDLIRTDDTIIIAPESCASKIGEIIPITAGVKKEIKNILVEAVPAYNTNKSFHPKGFGVGYVITIGGKRIYHAGDTDRIPEMKNLKNIDIALIPVSGTYVMTAEEAALAVNEDIKPRIAIPMHYGSIIGTKADAEKFKKLCRCKVEIL